MIQVIRTSLALSLLAVASASFATDTDLKINGTVDIYYMRDLNEGAGDANLRFADTKKNSFTLNTALAKIRWSSKKCPVSATVDFGIGKQQDNANLAEPGGRKRYKNWQQAFLSYNMGGVAIDFGKFNTWLGYEGVENAENPVYSHGFVTTLGAPVYHFGARAKFKTSGMDVTGAVVRGWNEVEDSNDNLSYGLSVKKDISDKTSATLGWIGGNEGKNGQVAGIAFADGNKRETYAYDLIINHKVDDKTTVALEGLYGNALGHGGNSSAKWTGVSGWMSKKMTDKMTACLRLESFNDSDGQRSGIAQSLMSATLSTAWVLSPNGTLNLEFRSDRSNKSVFTKDGSGPVKSRNTLTAAYVLKF